MKDVVCFNYFFNDPDKNDAPFELSAPTTGRQGVARNFKKMDRNPISRRSPHLGHGKKRIPSECYIDFRQFKDFKSLEQYLTRMTEEEYNRYISAIDRFMTSAERVYFSTDNIYRTIADTLGLKRIA